MSNMLYRMLSKNKSVLTNGIVQRVTISGAPHYEGMQKNHLQKRAEKLVNSFLDSIKEKPSVFTSYLKQIAEERITEGVFLHELQIVLQILEEKAWQLVVEHMPQEEQVRSLGRITATIGSVKDELALIYLQHFEKAEMKAVVLQQHIEELTKGTDSGPIGEDDLPQRINVSTGPATAE